MTSGFFCCLAVYYSSFFYTWFSSFSCFSAYYSALYFWPCRGSMVFNSKFIVIHYILSWQCFCMKNPMEEHHMRCNQIPIVDFFLICLISQADYWQFLNLMNPFYLYLFPFELSKYFCFLSFTFYLQNLTYKISIHSIFYMCLSILLQIYNK